jgi:DNA-binding NarL/FixJ family response regulator
MKISVLIVDDHAAIRQGLRALLELETDVEVVAEAENGRQAVRLTRNHPLNVVIMDVAMPVLDGLQATRQILKQAPETKIVALTSFGDDECVFRLLEAGAAGFLIKQTAVNDLVRAIREVHRGKTFFSPLIAQRLYHRNQSLLNWGASQNNPQLTQPPLDYAA